MGKPGKIVYRELFDSDIDRLKVFCDTCSTLNYHNNISFESIKLDKMTMPYGQFFVGLDNDKIFTFAGVHRMPEINDKAWRCLFRGAQLPGYVPKFSTNPYELIIHFRELLYLQLNLVLSIEPDSEFYITSNIVDSNNGHSSRMDKIIMPHIAKRGIWDIYLSDTVLYNTRQNVWRVNVEEYYRQRQLYVQSFPK